MRFKWPRAGSVYLPARNKYNARKVKLDGHTFDSVAESSRYRLLVLLQERKQIYSLRIHPRFKLDVNGCHIADYVADFEYYLPDKTRVIEDVKGMRLSTYRLKAKLMLALHGIIVREVRP